MARRQHGNRELYGLARAEAEARQDVGLRIASITTLGWWFLFSLVCWLAMSIGGGWLIFTQIPESLVAHIGYTGLWAIVAFAFCMLGPGLAIHHMNKRELAYRAHTDGLIDRLFAGASVGGSEMYPNGITQPPTRDPAAEWRARMIARGAGRDIGRDL